MERLSARGTRVLSGVGVFLYGFLRLQNHLLLSLGRQPMPPAQSFNTAASFVTNTNWQSYAGEAPLGHLVQMAGLAVQNFVSAAVGIAVRALWPTPGTPAAAEGPPRS
ncbi:hypothetical protein GCM10017744_026830 [Streptomyces antimycoticus]|uniref:Uncharacterized protein n=1 Tax=Streptomyces antimycoticus TaxID=68175 RepID=A0A4D4KKR8_9ACTN|nr:hypothetical protein SANT12839_075510 [Streptomyces antimycoticus]